MWVHLRRHISKIGFNVASLESPLYISFIGGVDGYAGAFGYGLAMYGAELQGRKSFGGRTSLLYSFGGGAANSIYAFAQGKAEAANGGTGDVGYSLFGSSWCGYKHDKKSRILYQSHCKVL